MLKSIQIYTAGCPRSIMTKANLKKAVQDMDLNVEVENIDDPEMHREHNVNVFPTIKINGEVKSEGSFGGIDFFKDILSEYL